MTRGPAVVVACVLLTACGQERPEPGQRVAVSQTGAEAWFDPIECGTPFPRLVAINSDSYFPSYTVWCPELGEVRVPRVYRPGPVERVLGRFAWGFRYVVWSIIAIALAGLVLPGFWPRMRDPFGLVATRARLDAARAAHAPGVEPTTRLEPLRCAACGTAVPLADADTVPCTHCTATVTVPDDYRAPARLRAAAASDLVAAARLWRLHAAMSRAARSWPVRFLLAFVIGLQVIGMFYGIGHGSVRGKYLAFVPAIILGAVILIVIVLRLSVRPAARVQDALVLPIDRSGEVEPCGVCGAPMRVPPPAYRVAACLYCGTEHLLGTRAARHRAIAAAGATTAAHSVLAATEAVHGALRTAALAIWGLAWFVVLSGVVLGTLFAGC